METLAARVRELRKLRGLTQAQLAERARMERTDIVRLESGKLRLGPARLGRVAEGLEVSVLELQPEAPPDERGVALADRLEELEARLAATEGRLERLLAAVLLRLDDLEAAQGTQARRASPRSTG